MMKLVRGDGEIRAVLSGEIDHHSARELRAELDAALCDMAPRLLVLDFGGVTFMDSSVVGLIMGRYKLMQTFGGEVAVEKAPPRIERMLRLSGVGQLAQIRPGKGNDE